MHTRTLTIGVIALALAACGGKESSENKPAAAPAAAPAAPSPTGKTIVIETYSDAVGNYFKPNKVEAHKGDVLRFTLASGVHNVHFLPDSNPGKSGLPPASEMLQIPGQTVDIVVTFDKGTYYFQCDPHALLGMKGHVTVE